MSLTLINEPMNGIKVLKNTQFRDNRGYFMEVYNPNNWRQFGLELDVKQVNQSGSMKNVVRGLHFQWEPPMGKLMRVTKGAAFFVAVDIRVNSPTLGQWFGISTTEDERLQVWAEAGFARGFCALTDYAEIQYLCTGAYNGATESGFKWNDADVGVKWPVENPIVSGKDDQAQTFKEWLSRPEAQNFKL